MKISVITPLYFGKKHVSNLIPMLALNAKNVAEQASVEYILVNDSPQQVITQQDIEECLEHLPDDLRIGSGGDFSVRLIANHQNCGIHYSRVHGLQESFGDYILYLDQDDEIADDALATFVKEVHKHPEADVLVANGYRKYKDDLQPLYSKDGILSMLSKEKYYIYGTDLIFSPGQCLISRRAISAAWQQYLLKVNGCDDFMLWLLMLNQNKKFIGIKDKLYYHIETESNYSNSYDAMQKSFFAMCDVLAQTKEYPASKISILKRRANLKSVLKHANNGNSNNESIDQSKNQSKNQIWFKMGHVIKNLDIIIVTCLYKLCGYR